MTKCSISSRITFKILYKWWEFKSQMRVLKIWVMVCVQVISMLMCTSTLSILTPLRLVHAAAFSSDLKKNWSIDILRMTLTMEKHTKLVSFKWVEEQEKMKQKNRNSKNELNTWIEYISYNRCPWAQSSSPKNIRTA